MISTKRLLRTSVHYNLIYGLIQTPNLSCTYWYKNIQINYSKAPLVGVFPSMSGYLSSFHQILKFTEALVRQ